MSADVQSYMGHEVIVRLADGHCFTGFLQSAVNDALLTLRLSSGNGEVTFAKEIVKNIKER